jgi:hypothetical protein
VSYLDARGASTITVELAIAWAGLPQGAQPISLAHRLGAVRGFARYLQSIDPATEVPPCGIWPSVAPRPTPYLWADADVSALLNAARTLQPRLRAATHAALFGLLATSGMRVGDALGLSRDDVDLGRGVITIREAKFGRSRLVPLHPSTTEALRAYRECRDQLCPTSRSTTFFVSSVGTALALVHMNTFLVQEVLKDPEWAGRLTDDDRRALSPLFWAHVKPYGRFDLDVSAHLDLVTAGPALEYRRVLSRRAWPRRSATSTTSQPARPAGCCVAVARQLPLTLPLGSPSGGPGLVGSAVRDAQRRLLGRDIGPQAARQVEVRRPCRGVVTGAAVGTDGRTIDVAGGCATRPPCRGGKGAGSSSFT